MRLITEDGLTFDDVLIVPQYSEIESRFNVDTSTVLAGIKLGIPILSANMDTVTEDAMAEAMARLGGLGIIHRFMSIVDQAEQVRRVKRTESSVITNPLTVNEERTVEEAYNLMEANDVGGILVVDANNRLTGILTHRDILFGDRSHQVKMEMTPRARLHVAKATEKIDLEEAKHRLRTYRVEKLPIVDEEWKIVGLITSRDIIRKEKYPHATRNSNGQLVVGAAIGTKLPEDLERCQALVEAGVDVVVIDIAHGHSKQMLRMLEKVKADNQVPVVAGNVATYEGALQLMEAGADVVKVGIGAGSICTTRIVTGSGVPQFTAISDSVRARQMEEFARQGKTIIADGGIRNSGDITKALAAGANAVMIGSLLAGTSQSPGRELVNESGQRVKIVRGMASRAANVARQEVDGKTDIDNIWNKIVPEGVEAIVSYRGDVTEVIYQLVGGLRSGMTYVGARSLEELYEKVVFIKITGSGKTESSHHDVNVI